MTKDAKVDPDRSHDPAPFDRADGFTGQDYRAGDERALGRDMPAGAVPPPGTPSAAGSPPIDAGKVDLPPDNGVRASVDPVTGEVRGSGIGAGGGQAGEDPDNDSATGDGPPLTRPDA